MAKAKTGSFFIRRTVDCSGTSPNPVTVDTSAYVDPADRQGIMIESVDFVWYNDNTNLPYQSASDRQHAVQMLTGAYTTLQALDEEDLIASASLVSDGAAGQYNAQDLYPDVLGTGDGRIVVDDQMTLLGQSSSAASDLACAVIIKAKVVQLTNKDYMALALQTVAN